MMGQDQETKPLILILIGRESLQKNNVSVRNTNFGIQIIIDSLNKAFPGFGFTR